MKKLILPLVVVVLAIVNVILLSENYQQQQSLEKLAPYSEYLTMMDGKVSDMRGIYTFPTIGQYIVPRDSTDSPIKASLSLVIFLSSETNCQMSLNEMEVFRRLIPIFKERKQTIVAVTSPEDSIEVSHYLDSISLELPLVTAESEQFDFTQMGISPKFMPFKILYDSSYTAIYMRGADNSVESQNEFEDAMNWLSKLIDENRG